MTAGTDQSTRELYEFGPFRVDAEKERLLRGDEPVPLMPKTFQILLVLIRNKKDVVTKDELMKSVWPDTFVEEANLSRNIFLLRKALGEGPQDHHYILTVPGRGYRFAEDVQIVPQQELSIVAASHAKVQVEIKETSRWPWVAAAAVLIALTAIGIRSLLQRNRVLSEKDTIVLADFSNSTGDPLFDDTLRQGLAVELEQSPFLSLVSDQRIRQTLQLMGQPSNARLTPQLAEDLCPRTQSAAYLTGSIASLGSQYVVGVKAVSCSTGDVLGQEQETASGKEKVLAALDLAAGKLRKRLGESLGSVQKFDTPLEQATTPSLEALQAYTVGRKTQTGKDDFASAIPLLQRAVRLDPNFAMAGALLGSLYWNTGETVQGAEYARRAYELHAPVSEPERFYIESTYYHYVLGDLEKTRQIYTVWEQTYPRNSSAPIRLRQLFDEEGKYEEALDQISAANKLDPSKGGLTTRDLVADLIFLNRLEEASTVALQAIANGFDSSNLRADLYRLAFLQNNPQSMSQNAQLLAGNPDGERNILALEALTAAYYGHLKKSRTLTARAAEMARHAEKLENAANYQAKANFVEALFGNIADTRSNPASSTRAPVGRSALSLEALSLAISGNNTRAQFLADDLARRYPDDTLVNSNFLPAIRAQIALNRHDPANAIEILEPASPYELSDHLWGFLGPVYVRGEAYLMAHRGTEAAAEFQRIIDHRGVVANSPAGALAHLQLGRAFALTGDKSKARTAYLDFLTLWKDADPEIPVLKQAKAEYAELH